MGRRTRAEDYRKGLLGPKPGAVALYDPQIHPREAQEFAMLGMTREEMAHIWEVHPVTVYGWQRDHAEFREALKAGGAVADAKVVRSLYKKACGYEYETVKTYRDKETGEIIQTPVTVVVEPDTQAAKHWLSCRQPHRWRDVQQVNLGVGRLEDLFSTDAQDAIEGQQGPEGIAAEPRRLPEGQQGFQEDGPEDMEG